MGARQGLSFHPGLSFLDHFRGIIDRPGCFCMAGINPGINAISTTQSRMTQRAPNEWKSLVVLKAGDSSPEEKPFEDLPNVV